MSIVMYQLLQPNHKISGKDIAGRCISSRMSSWHKELRANGWSVACADGARICLRCRSPGCPSERTIDLAIDPSIPAPCADHHVDGYGWTVVEQFRDLRRALIDARKSMGLTQEEVNALAGFTDGHISKLEAGMRTPQFPTFEVWAATLGKAIVLENTKLPPVVARTIARKGGVST